MPDEELKQKLTAILNGDVVGYSRLLSQDRVSTIRTLKGHRKLFSDFVQQYGGRIVDSPGDNILAVFDSVSDTVNCAVEIQRELAERNAEIPSARMLQWRIGISLGDVVEEDDGSIYGDGVNIAERVQGLAEAAYAYRELYTTMLGTGWVLNMRAWGSRKSRMSLNPSRSFVSCLIQVLLLIELSKRRAMWRNDGKR